MMADIVFISGLVLQEVATPSRSSSILNTLTPAQANAWQAQQDQLARQAYQQARPPSSASEMLRGVRR